MILAADLLRWTQIKKKAERIGKGVVWLFWIVVPAGSNFIFASVALKAAQKPQQQGRRHLAATTNIHKNRDGEVPSL